MISAYSHKSDVDARLSTYSGQRGDLYCVQHNIYRVVRVPETLIHPPYRVRPPHFRACIPPLGTLGFRCCLGLLIGAWARVEEEAIVGWVGSWWIREKNWTSLKVTRRPLYPPSPRLQLRLHYDLHSPISFVITTTVALCTKYIPFSPLIS